MGQKSRLLSLRQEPRQETPSVDSGKPELESRHDASEADACLGFPLPVRHMPSRRWQVLGAERHGNERAAACLTLEMSTIGEETSQNKQCQKSMWAAARQEGSSPCHLLTVRIISMKNVRQADILSQTDCFVTLWLPTASQKKLRTRTISNCPHPEWNESFTFQIQTRVKNVLEFSICDEDTLTQSDHLLTVLYDLSKLCLRNKTHVKFPLNPEGMEELEVEFLLEENVSSSETLITNGVLVSRQVSCLEVHAESRRPRKRKKNKNLLVMVTDSFENTQCVQPCLEPCCPNPACFHYPKYSQPQLYAEAPKSHWSYRLCCCEAQRNDTVCQPLDCLSDGQPMTLPLGENYELHMKSSPCSNTLDVRLGFSLCQEEVEFLQKRKVAVTKALNQVLQLEEGLHEHEVPMIAIMATGGGTRSMVSLYGHLLGLQKLNLLDCSVYLTGLSGAT
ncbi:cytosolic phospholipase A2 epsilon isoform X8 [Rattus norvegicus]|nr:cytosolic phospholipase A2 epsilon isoform X9 [Rattus norvegicus]